MTLADRIQLIDDLIKEDPDARIIDYIEAVLEYDMIELTKSKTVNKPKKYTVDDALFMLGNAEQYTAREMAEKLNIDLDTVYNFGIRNKLSFKAAVQPAAKPGPTKIREAYCPDAPKKGIVRVPGVYNNLKSNYL